MLEGSAYIFSDDANAEELDGTQEQNEHNDGGIARHSDASEQFFCHHPNQIENGGDACNRAENRCQTQGGRGVANNALNGIFGKLPEVPLGGAGGPLAGGVGDEIGIIANPGKNSFGEPMILGEAQNAVPDAPAEGPEVTGVRLQRHVRELVDNGIEALFKEGQNLTLPAAVLVGSHYVILGLFIQNLYHVPDDFRPLLQVGINKGDVLSGSVLESCVETGFLAKIPGEGDDLYGAFLLGMDFFQIVQGGILAAVVDEDDFIIISAAFKGGDHRSLKGSHIFCLIIAGNNQGQFHKYHSLSISIHASAEDNNRYYNAASARLQELKCLFPPF